MNYLSLLYSLYRFKRNTYKSREDILKLQDKKLKSILKYAYNHSDYYHRTFEDAGITEKNIDYLPINAFPTIDKQQFIKHFEEIVTEDHLTQTDLQKFDEERSLDEKSYANKYHLVHSSGSTGKPSYFIYDNKAWNQMLVGIIRAALWNMGMLEIIKLLANGPRIIYIAATEGRYGGAMAVGAGIEGVHAKQLFLDINQPVSDWIKSVQEFQPNIIIGYPSAIKILAELVDKREVDINVIRVISCGEPLSYHLRSYLERMMKADVINIYGASESLAIGVETSAEEGMYLFDDMNYIEIENGNMYLTSLYNYVQPLIRYKISDRLKMKDNYTTRYPYTLIDNILGRNEDMMWFENANHEKDFLHPLAIEGFTYDGMLDFQFHQIDKSSFEMFIQVSQNSHKVGIENYMNKQMEKILLLKNLDYVDFQIKFVDEIYPDKRTGKKCLIVKEENL